MNVVSNRGKRNQPMLCLDNTQENTRSHGKFVGSPFIHRFIYQSRLKDHGESMTYPTFKSIARYVGTRIR